MLGLYWVAMVLLLVYFCMIAAFAWGLIRIIGTAGSAKKLHGISVVVAMRNEQENVDVLIRSLSGQDFPSHQFEVILVNDHSVDDTLLRVQPWLAQMANLSVVSSSEGSQGKKQALALGVSLAQYDLVVFTDADCVHPAGWLSAVSAHFANPHVGMLVAPVVLAQGKGLFYHMQQLEHASLTAAGLGACQLGIPFMAASANLAFNKSALQFNLQQLNPSVASGDDVFLLHSAKRKRVKIACGMEPPLVVKTAPAPTVKEWLFQRARWASKAPNYSDAMAIGVGFVVLLFNLTLLVLMILSLFNVKFFMPLIIGLGGKSIADLLLLYPFLKRTQRLSSLIVFVPLQLVYPIYIVVAFSMGMFTKVSWKGRE